VPTGYTSGSSNTYKAKLTPKHTKRILVTGACGSIGEQILPLLRKHALVFPTDVLEHDTYLDVTDANHVREWIRTVKPTHILHLAGAKHAPVGESDPVDTFRVNTVGTANVLAASAGIKVVLTSTCKACNPETVYGASKLIAERMVLNAGGVVVRYYNVRETAGNVFRHWESLGESEPIPYTDCWRYFITASEAVRLTAAAVDLPSGRYTVDPGDAKHMLAEAKALYPRRQLVPIPPRRGDRIREPLHAQHEHLVSVPHLTLPNLVEIVNRHDLASDTDIWTEWFEARDAA
jgi:FlaA1/EpsC-like NDP-sugar epimerase